MEHEDLVLGIHYGHDATVVLMKDGEILEAMSEERLSRQKKHMGFPHEALAYIQDKYSIKTCKSVVVVGENPDWDGYIFTTKEDNQLLRKKGTPHSKDFLRAVGFRFPLIGKFIALRDFFLVKKMTTGTGVHVDTFLKNTFPDASIDRISHHYAHAWAAIPFLSDTKTKRLILTLDGAGDNLSGSINMYENGTLTQLHTIPMSASVGLLYCAIVDLLGMTRNEHEFKVMGLAPYAKASSGEKVYEKLKQLVWFDEVSMTMQSSVPLNRATPYLLSHDYFYHRFDSLAYGMQKLTEELIKDMARAAIKKYGVADIAVGGGVFMNVKANQYLLELPEVKSLMIIPSCGDESLAIGACTYGYAKKHEGALSGLKTIKNLYLGSSYSQEDIKKAVDVYSFTEQCSVTFFDIKKGESIEKRVAELLSTNNVVGRFKGRAEWGARALGNRSIVANPSSRDNVKLINEMIKGRDFWMPFATSLLYEERDTYLDVTKGFFAPYMSITFNTKDQAHKDLIAALHPYDLTSRPQMVTKDMNEDYHALISHFKTLTGIGGILNTSFNLHGEPNVETPYDALRTFDLSGLQYLALGDYLISKK
jgi:carbamoyltransferase